MRTADDFDAFYAAPDPWRLAEARFRDRVLRKRLSRLIRGQTVLELGCGEGHLTETLFRDARAVTGIDISDVAIQRARARGLPNATFESSDFMSTPFGGYDIVVAIECIYYLSDIERRAFFDKVVREHAGKGLVLSAPIIGDGEHRRYFTHAELAATFEAIASRWSYHNLIIRRRGPLSSLAAAVTRLPGSLWLLDAMREPYVFQRCYIAELR